MRRSIVNTGRIPLIRLARDTGKPPFSPPESPTLSPRRGRSDDRHPCTQSRSLRPRLSLTRRCFLFDARRRGFSLLETGSSRENIIGMKGEERKKRGRECNDNLNLDFELKGMSPASRIFTEIIMRDSRASRQEKYLNCEKASPACLGSILVDHFVDHRGNRHQDSFAPFISYRHG